MAAIGRSLVFAFACAMASAQTPRDVLEFLHRTALSLANGHEEGPQEFLDLFDRDMPGYSTLRANVETLLARAEVGSAIEIVTESGDAKKRTMELDWVLEVQDQLPRRKLLKCTLEKRGKNWKFTSLEPVDFFKF